MISILAFIPICLNLLFYYFFIIPSLKKEDNFTSGEGNTMDFLLNINAYRNMHKQNKLNLGNISFLLIIIQLIAMFTLMVY